MFSLVPPSTPPGPPGEATSSERRGLLFDWISDRLVEPVRAYVLNFPVNAIVDSTVDFLEGDKPEGLSRLREMTQLRGGLAARP